MDTWWICRKFFISNRKGGHTGFYVDVLFAKSDISLSKWQKNRSRLNKPIFFFPLSVQFKRRFWIHFFANQAWFLSLFSKKGHQSQSNEKSFGWKNTFFVRISYNPLPHVVRKKTWKCVDEMPIRALFSLFRLLGFMGFDCQIVV